MKAEEFITLLARGVKGEAAVSTLLATRSIEEFSRQMKGVVATPSVSDLTEREIEVLKLVTDGDLNKEIAKALYITENTVKYHLRNIMEKLHLRNRAQVAAYAVSKGIIPHVSPNE